MDRNNRSCSDYGPLLLLPGLMCDSRVFEGQLTALPSARVASDYGDCDRLEAMAERVLQGAPERFALLGHSMGARVALEIVRCAPGRVTRLALISTGVHPVQRDEAEKRYALRDLGRAEGMAALVDAWLPPMVASQHRSDADLMLRLREMCCDAGLLRYEAQIEALLTRPAVEDLLATITCPVFVAVGSEDCWSPPKQHEAIVAAIPGADLAVIVGAGHMLPAEAPSELNAAIGRWLRQPTNSHDKPRSDV
jgi:pimeloyl-ACP methyl ester carboxylesterase